MTKGNRQPKDRKPKTMRSSMDGVQIGGIVVIALVLGGILWMLFGRGANAPRPRREWDSPPPMSIDPARSYQATIKMAKGGEIDIQLRADKAPLAVNNFIFLAKEGYYDGVTFHRVLEGFMAQGGDPTGTGGGGPGYEFPNEDSDLAFDSPGVVAMANAGRDTNGSQFFITLSPQPQLNGDYTIFGTVVRGMDVVNGLTRRDPDQNPSFAGDTIETVTITEQ